MRKCQENVPDPDLCSWNRPGSGKGSDKEDKIILIIIFDCNQNPGPAPVLSVKSISDQNLSSFIFL